MLYHTLAIITRSMYTFYPLFEVHLCTATFGLMKPYSRAVFNQERVIVACAQYLDWTKNKERVQKDIQSLRPDPKKLRN